MTVLFSLFLGFLKVGLFSVGGGYAAIPLIQDQIVNTYQFLTSEEFADLITIAEMTPGPIAINAATFIGMRVGGPFGAILCTLGCICLPICICMVLGILYMKYRKLTAVGYLLSCMRAGVVSLIACAGLSIFTMAVFKGDVISLDLKDIKFVELGLFSCCLFLLRKFKINPIWIIWGSGFVGALFYL